MSLTFFDFDGTLTRRDSILPFGLCLARANPNKRLRTAHFALLMIGLKSRMLSNHQFKERFCRSFLTGESEKDIDDLARMFTVRYLEGILNRPVVETLRSHQQKGDEVYLVSSNFTFLLRPLQQTWNSSGVIATDLEIKSGRFTGRIIGRSCHGPEKLSRVLAVFGSKRVKEATAYGDSRSDRHLLAFVKTAVWV
jgi:phosphatidylglycerophosphatase C